MAVVDKFKSIIDTLTGSIFEPNDEEDFYDQITKDAEYTTVDNVALKPAYAETEQKKSKVASMQNYRGYEVIVSEPRSYEDSISIVKHLKDRKTVVLNLHLLDKEQAMRIVDFLCGATHALSGSQQKIGDSVFIFTPVNVALSAEAQKSNLYRDALWNQPQV